MALVSAINKLTLSLILDQLSFFVIMVVLFPHLTSLGGTQLYIGSTSSAMSLIGLIWNPLIGSLGDSYGRKLIMLRLLTICAISNLLLLISNSLAIIFISRIVAGFATPFLSMMNSLASDILTKQDQENHYSRLPTLMAVNMIVGSVLGGFLGGLNNGPFLCFALILILNLINIGVVSTLPDITKNKKEFLPPLQIANREMNTVITKLSNVQWNEYSDIFTAKLCIELSCALFFQSIGPSYYEYGYHGAALGYVFTLISVNTIVANILIGNMKKTIYAKDKFGRKRLYHSAALFLITAFILSFSNSIIAFSLGVMSMSVAKTIADSTFTEALMAKVSDKDRGGISGAFESIVSLCGLIIPISAGVLTDLYGIKFVLKISIIPTTIGLVLTYRDYSKQNQPN